MALAYIEIPIDIAKIRRQLKFRQRWLDVFSRRFFILMHGYDTPMDLSLYMFVALACYEVSGDYVNNPIGFADAEFASWSAGD